MSAASVISWMLARSPRPSAISRTAASTSACRVRAFRRSSREGRVTSVACGLRHYDPSRITRSHPTCRAWSGRVRRSPAHNRAPICVNTS